MYKISTVKLKKESDESFGQSSLGHSGRSGSQIALFFTGKNKMVKKKKIYQLGRSIPDAKSDAS